MILSKPSQQLRLDLREAAALLKWAGIDLFKAAETLLTFGDVTGANELMTLASSYQDMENKLMSYSDEAGDGRIVRGETK